MARVIVAGILGGLTMYMWGFVSHMLTPLGYTGFQHLETDTAVLGAMQSAGLEDAIYMLPSLDPDLGMEGPEYEAWKTRWEAGPTAFLVYRTDGGQAMSVMQLGIQALGSILAGIFGAVILCYARNNSYGGRVLAVTLVGVAAWVTIQIPHWNWYRFPGSFTMASFVDVTVAWLAAGIVMAMIVRPEARGAEV